jgi:hypothetical protein
MTGWRGNRRSAAALEVAMCNFELSPEAFAQRRVEMIALADQRRLALALKPARQRRERFRRKPRVRVGRPSVAVQAGLVDPLVAWRILLEQPSRPDRSRDEVAAAIRADLPETVFDAMGAERALVGADHGVGGIGTEVKIAALAGGT